jgi:hypothetical protein
MSDIILFNAVPLGDARRTCTWLISVIYCYRKLDFVIGK